MYDLVEVLKVAKLGSLEVQDTSSQVCPAKSNFPEDKTFTSLLFHLSLGVFIFYIVYVQMALDTIYLGRVIISPVHLLIGKVPMVLGALRL